MGLVVRDHIMVLLRQALGRGSASAVDASWEELNRRYVSTEGQRLVSEQQVAVLQVNPKLGWCLQCSQSVFGRQKTKCHN